MTRDLARALDEEFAACTPPTAITRELIIHRGRRVRRRRRLALGGGTFGLVAGVVAAALVLAPVAGVPIEPPVAIAQPEFPLPELDPDEEYFWVPSVADGRVTPDTAKLDKAYLEHLAAFGRPLVTAGANPITRYTYTLGHGDAEFLDPNAYSSPVYFGGDVGVTATDGEYMDSIHVRLSAKGSFLPGAGQPKGPNPNAPVPYLVPGCEDYTFDRHLGAPSEIDFECAERTGPNGERMIVVTRVKTAGGGEQWMKERFVVVYRLDGTALTVTDDLVRIDGAQADLRDAGFGLSEEDLVALALAMPDLLVR
ncbi:hypothetical protein [Phytomonospora endophytica]|uniref:Uncharacterized protein n=1 Tax=Phytomonospora endophytica TaxID=714109 RepID=A0A841FKF8_9ACTN|nr:hypothetical protein [Phytomonospora endophytica]MBB6036354.1 hypothetical protein [Phytomonospora endophytica]GIG67261.1 hypothetical protein Pen01_35560 [Phytomonospora endophytica]